ncbi:MAG: hypothetical protein KC777_08685 [Cyanobacteria bacterium HKST-UBA02]|nr:hypothetical protein [Cyanobacteria bacterium HKST-UBA02]
MEHFNSADAAFTIMSEAGDGKNISNRYNSLTPSEQKEVFTRMQDLQSSTDTMKLFGNVQLFDSNRDGIMDDARSRHLDGSVEDVYDSNAAFPVERGAPESGKGPSGPGRSGRSQESGDGFRPLTQREISRDPHLQQADIMLGRASRGQDIYSRYSTFGRDPGMLEAMREVQESKPQYGNVSLIDQNGDGILDDARAVVNGRYGQTEVDVFKTPGDRLQEKTFGQADNAIRRGGEIVVDEFFRGMQSGNRRGPGTGERILDRMGRESTRGSQRVLRDVIRGRY